MFAPLFRSTVDTTSHHVSEWPLSTEHSLLLPLQRGDTVRTVHGTVWFATPDQAHARTLSPGDVHTVPRDGVLRLIGADHPRIALASRSPVVARAQADYGAWRLSPALPCAH